MNGELHHHHHHHHPPIQSMPYLINLHVGFLFLPSIHLSKGGKKEVCLNTGGPLHSATAPQDCVKLCNQIHRCSSSAHARLWLRLPYATSASPPASATHCTQQLSSLDSGRPSASVRRQRLVVCKGGHASGDTIFILQQL